MRYNRGEKTGGQQSQVRLSAPKAAEPSTMPFAQRLTCTIDDACEVTGLGRTKLYDEPSPLFAPNNFPRANPEVRFASFPHPD